MTSLFGVQKRSVDCIMLVTIVLALPWRGIITGNDFAIETCGSVYLNKILDWGVRRAVGHCPTASSQSFSLKSSHSFERKPGADLVAHIQEI